MDGPESVAPLPDPLSEFNGVTPISEILDQQAYITLLVCLHCRQENHGPWTPIKWLGGTLAARRAAKLLVEADAYKTVLTEAEQVVNTN